MWKRVFRPRTLVYTALLLAIIAAAADVSLYLRNPLKVDVIRDRGALAREAAPGMIENVYRLQIMNTDENAAPVHDLRHRPAGPQGRRRRRTGGVDGAATRCVPFSVAGARRGGCAAEARNLEPRSKSVVQAVLDPAIDRSGTRKSTFLFPR